MSVAARSGYPPLVPVQDPFHDLGRMDATFSSSSRRAAARRTRSLRRRVLRWVVTATGAITATVFGLSGELNGLGATASQDEVGLRAGRTVAACPVPDRFHEAFTNASRDSGIPLPVLVAVAEEESRFQPGARSSTGAEGLLQLMPDTARELQLDVALPHLNVLAGARYLEQMLERFGRLDLALSAYNGGPAAVAASGAVTPVTAGYVENVTRRAERIGACI